MCIPRNYMKELSPDWCGSSRGTELTTRHIASICLSSFILEDIQYLQPNAIQKTPPTPRVCHRLRHTNIWLYNLQYTGYPIPTHLTNSAVCSYLITILKAVLAPINYPNFPLPFPAYPLSSPIIDEHHNIRLY